MREGQREKGRGSEGKGGGKGRKGEGSEGKGGTVREREGQ